MSNLFKLNYKTRECAYSSDPETVLMQTSLGYYTLSKVQK